MKRWLLILAASTSIPALFLGALVYQNPAYAHLCAGEARVLSRDRTVSLTWETPVHPQVEVYRADTAPEQIVLWVPASQLADGRFVILIDPRTWEFRVPNAGPNSYARMFSSWLIQADDARGGGRPSEWGWSPQVQVETSGASFTLPAAAFQPSPRVSLRFGGAS